MKKILQLDSHMLTAYQKCPQSFFLHYVANLEVQKRQSFYDEGTLTHRLLAAYYYRKMKGKWGPDEELWSMSYIKHQVNKLQLEDHVKSAIIVNNLSHYTDKWKSCNWKPLAIEAGFSKILYEDNDFIFIYEGRPDLIALADNKRIAVDHKTQGSQYSIYNFNNQAIGYCWAADCEYFVYNYIKWVKDSKDAFRREPFKFRPDQIEAWKAETIQWFKEIADHKESGRYLRSLQCQGKYGNCVFTPICEEPITDSKEWVIYRSFKARESKWKPW